MTAYPRSLLGAGTGDTWLRRWGWVCARARSRCLWGPRVRPTRYWPAPTHDPTGAVAGFCDAAGGFLLLVCTFNATRVTDSVARWLGLDRDGFAEAALSAPPGAGGVVLVPYFDGERTPNLPGATGTFTGIRNATAGRDLVRAAHEGVVCALLDGIDALAAAGATIGGRLYLVGRGSQPGLPPGHRRLLGRARAGARRRRGCGHRSVRAGCIASRYGHL